jgi:hypothetical protein
MDDLDRERALGGNFLTRLRATYNEHRVHGSLNGKTPWEKWWDLLFAAPYRDEVEALFDETKEPLRLQNYKDDLLLLKLKRSM